MTLTFVLAPAHSNVQIQEDVRAMLEAGDLAAYVVRNNGRYRRMILCPLGSTDRDTAEWISERLNDGASVGAVARELHVSPATVRRFQLSLELVEEIEAGEWDGIFGDNYLDGEATVEELAADADEPEGTVADDDTLLDTVSMGRTDDAKTAEPGTVDADLEAALVASLRRVRTRA